MPSWLSASVVATLVVVFPYSLLFKILLQLPKPVALSNRRWPLSLNIVIIVGVAAWITVFIHGVYYRRGSMNPAGVLMEFIIAGLAYAFGLVLLMRQFSGLYPEFVVTTGRSGLALRKVAYRNIVNIEEVARSHGESHLRLRTSYGSRVLLTLPARDVASLYERVRPPL
jgi:hypothetical protein